MPPSTCALAPRACRRPGHAVVRHAACPKGCDLHDPQMRVAGQPGIRVLRLSRPRGHRPPRSRLRPGPSPRESASGRGHDPRLCLPALPHASRAARTGAASPAAPVIAVRAGRLGLIEWCARAGCRWTRWAEVDARGPQPFAELIVEDSGRGIALVGSRAPVRAVLLHQGESRHRARPGRQLGHRRRPRRIDRRGERARPGHPLLRASPCVLPEDPPVEVSDALGATTSRACEVGATAFLAKPFDDLELMTLVRLVAGKEGRS